MKGVLIRKKLRRTWFSKHCKHKRKHQIMQLILLTLSILAQFILIESVKLKVCCFIWNRSFSDLYFLLQLVNHAGRPIELFWINTYERLKGGELNLVKQTTKPLRNDTDANVRIYFQSVWQYARSSMVSLFAFRLTASTLINFWFALLIPSRHQMWTITSRKDQKTKPWPLPTIRSTASPSRNAPRTTRYSTQWTRWSPTPARDCTRPIWRPASRKRCCQTWSRPATARHNSSRCTTRWRHDWGTTPVPTIYCPPRNPSRATLTTTTAATQLQVLGAIYIYPPRLCLFFFFKSSISPCIRNVFIHSYFVWLFLSFVILLVLVVLTVNVLHDEAATKIWYVEDFVTDDECAILMHHGGPRLRRATVAAEDGSSIVSEHRKAQQASYTLEDENDALRWVMTLSLSLLSLSFIHR